MHSEPIIQKTFALVIVASGLLLLSSLGCASTQQGIPVGEWAGQGTYVDYEASGPSDTVTQNRSKDSVYKTSLKIVRKELFGHEALTFDICSKRGKLFDIKGEESHVVFSLVPLETLEHGSKLYACCQFEYNPSKEQVVSKKDFDQRLQYASATCVQQDSATILQIYYAFPSPGDSNGFYDTFIFEGDQVRKLGRYIEVSDKGKKDEPKEAKLVTVHWAETLRKVK